MFFAYLLASQPYGTLYIGSTSDLVRRVWKHKLKAVPGVTAKYGVDRLVWFERHDTLEAAMQREKRIKSWKRAYRGEDQALVRAARWVPASAGKAQIGGRRET
ncbi:MAG TPA: GIY-YIG nuclease family protein [Stellaceae bacterium]|nr:GIY-YIG nuclease family protein [Stellaceae bacterium]